MVSYLVSIDDMIDVVGGFLEELTTKSKDDLTFEQKLIALADYFNTGEPDRFLIVPAIVADELLINFYDRLTMKLATRMSADRAVEEYKRRQTIIEKNRE